MANRARKADAPGSRDNIQAIAERIGYESQFAFNRAFKKATGCPPALWRRAAGQVSREH